MKSTFLSLLLLAAASTTPTSYAQLPSGLLNSPLLSGVSTSCLSSLVSLVGSDLATCLHLTSAAGLLSNEDQSIAGPLDSFLSDEICNNQPCSQQTLSSGNSTLRNGCGNELQKGMQNGNVTLPVVLAGLIDNYDVVRQAGCLMDKNAGDETCVAQYVYTIQNVTGQTVSINNVMSLASNMGELTKVEQQLAANETAFCTPCTQALYATLEPTIKSNFNQSVQQNISQTLDNVCGQSFTSGGLPSSIKNGTVESTTSSNDQKGNSDSASTMRNGLGSVGIVALVIGGLALLV